MVVPNIIPFVCLHPDDGHERALTTVVCIYLVKQTGKIKVMILQFDYKRDNKLIKLLSFDQVQHFLALPGRVQRVLFVYQVELVLGEKILRGQQARLKLVCRHSHSKTQTVITNRLFKLRLQPICFRFSEEISQ